MSESVTAYIALGANLGDRELAIKDALQKLDATEAVEVVKTSEVIETAPLAGKDQLRYLNAVAEIETALSADQLLGELKRIEKALGRKPAEKWSSRTIDLDILLFGSEVIKTDDLTIPHAQMHLRSFVLKPLGQLAPHLIHPILNRTVKELADRLGGADFVLNPEVPQLISIAGVIGSGKTTLAKAIADKLNCKILPEAYDTNPFLPEVYSGKKELALDSQLYFLTERAAQLSPEVLSPGKVAVSDYIFEKEFIYARRLLGTHQLYLYQKICKRFADNVVKPVLTIFLEATPQLCMDRIHKRNRTYEQGIDIEILKNFADDYNRLFENFKTSPVIKLSASEFDCRRNSGIIRLFDGIKSYIATE